MFKIYVITDSQKSFETNYNRILEIDNLEMANQIAIQIRFPNFDDRDIFEFSKKLKSTTKNVKLFINEAIDIMEILNLDGVHLKSRSVPIDKLREYFKNQYIIGKSTHSISEIQDTFFKGGDFVTFGPIFDTFSKRGMGQPLGVDSLKNALNIDEKIAIFPLGGISESNIQLIKETSSKYLAGIGMFFSEPISKVESIISDFLKN
ncbi:thiamine phosphate synthase [bacterium]|nr:thiamine phosphate synthase [bacterium]